MKGPGGAVTMLRGCRFGFRGGFKRGFLVSAKVLRRVVRTTRVAGSSFILRVNPKVKAVARCLYRTTHTMITIRVSAGLVPVLGSALTRCGGISMLGRSVLGMGVSGLTRRGGGKGPVGIITGLPCCVAAPVVVKLFRDRIPVSDVAVVMRGRMTSHVRRKPKDGRCNTLSLTIRCCTGPRVMIGIPPDYFVPRPGINDTIVHLAHRDRPPIAMGDRGLLFRIVQTSFGRHEGALTGKLTGCNTFNLPGRRLRTYVRRLNMPIGVHKRTLSLRRFTRLSGVVCSREDTMWGRHKRSVLSSGAVGQGSSKNGPGRGAAMCDCYHISNDKDS